jgi:hypothetical protein
MSTELDDQEAISDGLKEGPRTKEERESKQLIEDVVSGKALELCLFDTQRFFGVVNLETGIARLRKVTFIDEPTMPNKRREHYVERSLPLKVGHADSISLPYGLTVISGTTAAGKSTLLRALGRAPIGALPNVERVLAVENPDDVEELENLRIFRSVDAALLRVARDTVVHDRLYAIDSLRAPLFEINGPASTKGVIMPFFTAITRVSNQLARNGITMLATVNPMDEDVEYGKAFLSKLAAAAACFIVVDKYTGKKTRGARETGVFEGSIASREEREPQRFIYDASGPVGATSEQVTFNMPPPLDEDPSLSSIQVQSIVEN